MLPLVESTKYWGWGPAVELAALALLALWDSMLAILFLIAVLLQYNRNLI